MRMGHNRPTRTPVLVIYTCAPVGEMDLHNRPAEHVCGMDGRDCPLFSIQGRAGRKIGSVTLVQSSLDRTLPRQADRVPYLTQIPTGPAR
jgi:hypothetical protein